MTTRVPKALLADRYSIPTSALEKMRPGLQAKVVLGTATDDDRTEIREGIQVAVNSGAHIRFPVGRYLLDDETITVAQKGQILFWDTPLAAVEADTSSVEFQPPTPQGPVFNTTRTNGNPVFLANAQGVRFINLGFYGEDRENDNIAIRFKRDANSDDLDGFVIGCKAMYFDTFVEHDSRALTALDNYIMHSKTAFRLTWNPENPIYPFWQQPLPYGHRACRIMRNRGHAVTTLIELRDEPVREAQFHENMMDNGGVLLRGFTGSGLYRSSVRGNVVGLALSEPVQMDGCLLESTSFGGNSWGGPEGDEAGSPFRGQNGMRFGDCEIKGLSIDDMIHSFNGSGIRIHGTSTIDGLDVAGRYRDLGKGVGTFAAVQIEVDAEGFRFTGDCYGIGSTNIVRITDPALVLTRSQIGPVLWDRTAVTTFVSTFVNGGDTAVLPRLPFNTSAGGLLGINGDWIATSQVNILSTLFRTLRLERTGSSGAAGIEYANTAGTFTLRGNPTGTNAGFFAPDTPQDGNVGLGTASARFSEVFAATGTINTSDVREKQDVRDLTDAERRVAQAVKGLLRAYRWKDAVAVKGDAARIHFGVMAQDVIGAFEADGLDPFAYGVVCFDEWEAEPEETDENGNVTREATPAGNRYGVRYDQLMAFVLAAL
jgi:hypothetical protein